jgi:hypothetical protein
MIKKIVAFGDTFTRGDGSEFPKVFAKMGALPSGFKQHDWIFRLRKEIQDYSELKKDFAEVYGPKLVASSDFVLEARKKDSWLPHVAKYFKIDNYENVSNNFSSLGEYLPFYSYHGDDNLNDTLVICGVLPILNDLTFNHSNQSKLKNITIPLFASYLLLLKEYVENRGGIFVYFHTQDFPEELYNPEYNPFLLELRPLLLVDGLFSSNMGNSFSYRRFDGVHFDSGGQKEIARIIIEQLESPDFIRIFK